LKTGPTTVTPPVVGNPNVYFLAGWGGGVAASIIFTLPFTTDLADIGPLNDEINYVWPYFSASDTIDGQNNLSDPFTYSHTGLPLPGEPRPVQISAQAIVYVSDVPEPASLALLGIGGLALLRRRREKAD
jgi:hypothetical protein